MPWRDLKGCRSMTTARQRGGHCSKIVIEVYWKHAVGVLEGTGSMLLAYWKGTGSAHPQNLAPIYASAAILNS